MAKSVRKVSLMATDTCDYYVNFIGQLFIDSVGECTKDVEFHVFRHHLLALKRK